MAWIYFQEAGDSQKDCTTGCVQSLTVKSSEELSVCCCPEWQGENSTPLRSGMMCALCEGVACRSWILLPADFLARTSVSLELEQQLVTLLNETLTKSESVMQSEMKGIMPNIPGLG